jgi:HD-GYP domain-containing protein (c-di-GMP phosphodiesterase class II)
MHPSDVNPLNSTADHDRSVQERLLALHEVVRSRFAFLDRIAIAVYDGTSDMLKTFASSNTGATPLQAYEARLADIPSLRAVAEQRQPRVVDDIERTFTADTEHSRWLRQQGFRSSFTIPIYFGDALAGFLFFDSRAPSAFAPNVTDFLKVFGEIAAQLYLLRLTAARGLLGAVHLASRIASIRDVETGAHLERMAKYSRLIARNLSHYGVALTDEFVEYVHTFATLHDVGKVGIPDRILLKPGPLDAAEWIAMRRHVEIGVRMVDDIIADLGLVGDQAATVMRNIVSTHHERGDGSGYPRGLRSDAIPLEGRIVAVADVFDALTTRRPYKQPWPSEQAFAELERDAAAGRMDPACVAALVHDKAEVEHILCQFADATVH